MAARETKFLWKLCCMVKPVCCKRVDLFSDPMGRWQRIRFCPLLQSILRSRISVRELVKNGIVTVSFVRTAFMVAGADEKLGPG